MAKKTAVKRVRTNKSKVAFEAYVAKVAEFLKQLQNRTSTEHSKTPANATRDGKTGPATICSVKDCERHSNCNTGRARNGGICPHTEESNVT